jgi:N utilization substance protein B
MHPKRKVREYALQVLFLWDANGAPDTEAADRAIKSGTVLEGSSITEPVKGDVRVDAMDMARGVWLEREQIDARLEKHAPQWPVKRQPGVDRTLLRMAVWEMTRGKVDPAVVIDEAIELARQYSTENSPAFVNGVLDAVLKENQAVTKGIDELPKA